MAREQDIASPLSLAPILEHRLSEEQSPPQSPKHEDSYHLLSNNPVASRPAKAKIYTRLVLKTFGYFIIFTFALVGLFNVTSSVYKTLAKQDKHTCSCGDTVAEAIRMGCKYDLLASAWLPPHSIDEELSAEFEKAGPGEGGSWKYYADNDGTIELSIERIPPLADTPEQLIYATKEWHLIHCFFYWRKLIRSQSTGVTVEPRYDNEGHAIHCSKMLYQNATLQDVATLMSAALDSSGKAGKGE